uniref:Uncharacterized protein n=1 Tax=Arundo donax TaxID=35708 RepID=A0A0A9FQI1_ARUDO
MWLLYPFLCPALLQQI